MKIYDRRERADSQFRNIINRCGGWRGVLIGLIEGLLMFGSMGVWMALIFMVAPMAGR